MASADRPLSSVERIGRLLDAQRAALASRDPAELERANAALGAALEALRRTPPDAREAQAARRSLGTLRAQAELIARGQAGVERALAALIPEADRAYAAPATGPTRAGRRHAIA